MLTDGQTARHSSREDLPSRTVFGKRLVFLPFVRKYRRQVHVAPSTRDMTLEYIVVFPPILNAPDYIVNVSANKTQVIIGVLFKLINCAAVVVIPIILFPIFKKHNEALALGYVGSRIIESVTLIVASISLLSLLTLSQEYVQAAAPDASYFQTLGTLLLAVSDWSILLGDMIVFSLTALILNYLLYQSKLIPRFISVWVLLEPHCC